MKKYQLSLTIVTLSFFMFLFGCSAGGETGESTSGGKSDNTGSSGNTGNSGSSGNTGSSGNAGSGDSMSSDNSNSTAVGTLSCQQLEQCYAGCNENDSACENACYDKGTADAQKQSTALYECYESKGLACDNNWSDCVTKNCASQQTACNNDKSTGGSTCSQLNTCYDDCDGDSTCEEACYNKGTEAAKKLSEAFSTCITNAKCDDSWTTCYTNACGALRAACK